MVFLKKIISLWNTFSGFAKNRGAFLERYHSILTNKTYKSLVSFIEEKEQTRKFCKHTFAHFCDVARIMYILSLEEQSEYSQDIIYATALLHDIGRAKEYQDGTPHEIAGKEIASQILTETGYTDDEISLITDAIGKHRTNSEDTSDLATYLYRADKLSRICFSCPSVQDCYWADNKKNQTLTI